MGVCSSHKELPEQFTDTYVRSLHVELLEWFTDTCK